jgi:hypothetical protein
MQHLHSAQFGVIHWTSKLTTITVDCANRLSVPVFCCVEQNSRAPAGFFMLMKPLNGDVYNKACCSESMLYEGLFRHTKSTSVTAILPKASLPCCLFISNPFSYARVFKVTLFWREISTTPSQQSHTNQGCGVESESEGILSGVGVRVRKNFGWSRSRSPKEFWLESESESVKMY